MAHACRALISSSPRWRTSPISSTDPRVVVFGSASVDLTAYGDRLPAPGETVLAGDYLRCTGGKGANQAVAAALGGARTFFAGCVGNDAFGDEILATLPRHGVDVSSVVRCDVATAVALIMVDAEGRNLIAVASGANSCVSAELAEGVRALLDSDTVVVLQLEVPIESVTAMARLASAAGARVVLNPAPARQLPAELLASTDVLVPNQIELSGLAPNQSEAEPESLCRRLLEGGVGAVVATLGAAGALVVTPAGSVRVPGHPVPVVDTTGAGDAFVGGLAARLAAGDELIDAVRYGNAAGALSVERRGTQPSFRRDEEVRQLLKG